MPDIDLSFAKDPNTLALAIVCGMIPALVWLFFWLRENRARPRPASTLFYVFLGGVFMVILSLPVEKFIASSFSGGDTLTILFAGAEEALKFGIFLFILSVAPIIESPIDYPVYVIVVALGFAGFENALYFLKPLQTSDTAVLILSGAMRFLGTTLMHAAAASLAGIGLGLAYFRSKGAKIFAALFGLLCAIALHSTFNILIVRNAGQDFFQVFGFLWVITIIIMVLFEELRKMGSASSMEKKKNEHIEGAQTLFLGLVARLGVEASDPAPLVESLKAKNFPEGGAEYAQLAKLLAVLRREYESYMSRFGANRENIETATRTLIPDTVSAKSIAGILEVLKKEKVQEPLSE